MPAIFIGSWSTLRFAGMQHEVAFVWAAVLAQAAQIWCVLPVSVWRQRVAFGRARHALTWAMTVILGAFAFQIWWSEPWMTQRVLSVYCALYAAAMALGVAGDRDILDRFAPVSGREGTTLEFRRHLLKLYALVAILVLAVNETLLATDAPLSVRVVTLSLLPVILHYVFVITLRLTCPPLDEGDA